MCSQPLLIHAVAATAANLGKASNGWSTAEAVQQQVQHVLLRKVPQQCRDASSPLGVRSAPASIIGNLDDGALEHTVAAALQSALPACALVQYWYVLSVSSITRSSALGLKDCHRCRLPNLPALRMGSDHF